MSSEIPLLFVIVCLLICVIPGILFAMVFYRADRYEREPTHYLVLVFLWGMVPSVLISQVLNPHLIGHLARLDRATVDILVAPAIEEILKMFAIASIFVLARQEFDGVLDGLVYGAMVGIGFATAENYVYYLDAIQTRGWYALFELFILRGLVFGLSHAMYSGIVGVGFGMARHVIGKWKRIKYIAAGIVGAYAVHAVHNYGGRSPGIGTALSIMLASGGFLVWYIGFQLSYRNERQVLITELRDEIGSVISQHEYENLTQSTGRPNLLDNHSNQAQAKRLRLAVELANRKHRIRNIGVHLEDELPMEIMELRSRIAALQESSVGRP